MNDMIAFAKGRKTKVYLRKRTTTRRALLCILCFVTFINVPAFARETDQGPSIPHVLFLSSYDYEWESIPRQFSGVAETLDGHAQVDYVFMDNKRQDYEDVKARVHSDIIRKGKGHPFSYVIVADDAALRFVHEYRKELFKGVPIVFEGINDEDFANQVAKDPLITGIVETFPIDETIALALKLNPSAREVVAVTDDTFPGRGSTKQFMDVKDAFPSLSFSLIDCSSLSRAEIGKTVATYGDDTILLFLMMTTDADGNHYSQMESLEYLTQYAKVPIYKSDELGIGQGALGGVVVSYHDMAGDAAGIVLKMIDGSPITALPLVQPATHYCMFDKNVMDAFGITKKEVEKASSQEVVFLNDEHSVLEKHANVIIPLAFAIAFLTIFVVFS